MNHHASRCPGRGLLLALSAFAVGCAGKTEASSDGGVLRAEDSTASNRDDAFESGSASTLYGPEAGVGSASACQADASADAKQVQCGDAGTFRLYTGGERSNCELTPAQVTCDTTADCEVFLDDQCSCVGAAYGARAACSPVCPPPPCPPHACPVTGFLTQDCQLVASLANVGVACVGHQCLTYAVGSP